jgi:peptide/nickel transport system permease protein
MQFLTRRLIDVIITLFVVTIILYGVAMLAPLEVRAKLYWPPQASEQWLAFQDESKVRELNEWVIKKYGLNDPFPVQYGRWLSNLLRGDWGSSFAANDVLPALIQRIPLTLELTLYSILLLVPLGLACGAVAGWHKGRFSDIAFRFLAFIGTSIPAFILAFLFLTFFYVAVRWFPPGRISGPLSYEIRSAASSFQNYTGMLTIDGVLNGRLDITLQALRHLVLPVITLSLAHWATLGRVTRASMNEELSQQYITAAQGRGLPARSIVWVHALRNAILPGLNSIAVSMASLITGVFVIEAVFGLNGVSELVVMAAAQLDLTLALGVAIFSVMMVLPLMFVFDVIQGLVDPRIREGDK